MEENDVRPSGLSSLRDGAAEASPPKASIPDAERLRVVSFHLSKNVKGAVVHSISQHWGIHASDAEAVGAALIKLPSVKPGFAVEQYLVCTPFAQAMEARRAETEPGSVHDSAVTK